MELKNSILSYSMLNDNNVNVNVNDKKIVKLDDRNIYKWTEDSSVVNCYNCESSFNIYNRRHHCRLCGRIFCYRCSDIFVIIPEELKISAMMPSSTINSKEKERICGKCFIRIDEFNKLRSLIIVFDNINLTIKDLLVIRSVCKQWSKVSNYFLSKIREIQYYVSNHKYTMSDKKILWNNREYFMGHSQVMINLIKSIDYENYSTTKEKMEEIVKLIHNFDGRKKVNCLNLMCSRQCKTKITIEDCLSLLNNNIKSKSIREYFIKYLSDSNIIEFTCYLPYFVKQISFETVEDSIIGNYLVEYSKKISNPLNGSVDGNNIIFVNEFYWLLTLNTNNKVNSQIYKYFIDKLCEEVNKSVIKLIKSGNNLIQLLKNIPINLNETDIRAHIKKNLEKINELSIPINPIINNISINVSEIKIKNSATMPIIFPMKYKKNNSDIAYNYTILYKKENVIKDKIIMNLIKLCDIILRKEEKMDMNIITYNICPINYNEGIIEFVDNATTLYDIKNKNISLLNFIIENNRHETIDVIKKKFLKSAAFYCVITFLIGVGDRHLENIMISATGRLFHIDYSYILGKDAKNITPNMRINSDMIDVLGGENSEYYIEFKNTCNIIYNTLRRHINLFINMLSVIALDSENTGENITINSITDELLKRFSYGENNQDATIQLYNNINNSKKDLTYILIDYLHYTYQETYIKEKLVDGYKIAKNFFTNLGIVAPIPIAPSRIDTIARLMNK